MRSHLLGIALAIIRIACSMYTCRYLHHQEHSRFAGRRYYSLTVSLRAALLHVPLLLAVACVWHVTAPLWVASCGLASRRVR